MFESIKAWFSSLSSEGQGGDTSSTALVIVEPPKSTNVSTELVTTDQKSSPSRVQTLMKMVADVLGVDGSAAGSKALLDNGFLLTGYVVAVLFGRRIFEWAASSLKYALISRMEIDSKDDSYNWLLTYLTDDETGKKFNHFAVSTVLRGNSTYFEENTDAQGKIGKFHELPSHGTHSFYHNGYLMWLDRGQNGVDRSASDVIQIDCLGPKSALDRLIMDSQTLYHKKDKHRTIVYACDQYGAWRRIRSRLARRLETVITAGTDKERVLADITDFLDSESWYTSRGIPYRRGYMFYGPPGTGKTSLVTALAGELGLNIYMVSLANKNLTDDTFIEALVDTPARCILLLEDIDAAFTERDANGNEKGVTFAGLLNAIDGVAAQEGRVLCLTTNFFERLDSALVRPGRIDVRVEFKLANKEMTRQLFTRFYECENDTIQEFVDKVPEDTFSMADIQGFMMLHKGDSKAALCEVSSWISETLGNRKMNEDAKQRWATESNSSGATNGATASSGSSRD